MRLFGKAKVAASQNGDVATIRDKLANCDRDIQGAETELRRVALGAVLSGDEGASNSIRDRLAGLRGRKELLAAALQGAELAERDALAALNARASQAAKRSLAQHSGRMQRDAADVTTALRQLNDALQRMTGSGQAITALLPAHLRSASRPFNDLLSDTYLRELGELEGWRLSSSRDPYRRPGLLGQFEDQRTGDIKPLAEIVSDLVASVRAEFETEPVAQPEPAAERADEPLAFPSNMENSSVSATDDVGPSAASTRYATDEAPAVDDVSASEAGVSAPFPTEVLIDLRGMDLGVPKVKNEAADEATAEKEATA